MPTQPDSGDERELLRRAIAQLRSRYRKLANKVDGIRGGAHSQAQAIDAKTTLILDSVRKLFEHIEGNGMKDSFDVRIERNAAKLDALREEVAELRKIMKENNSSQSGWVTLIVGAVISGAVAYAVAAATQHQ